MTTVEELRELIVREFAIPASDLFVQAVPDNCNGLCSESYKAELFRKKENGNKFSEKLFIKSLPKIGWKTDYTNLNELFQNEVFMFREVLVEIFNESKFKDELWNLFPKCLYSNDKLIIMEDLTQRGYRLGEKFLDQDHYHIALIALAKFHAANYAYKIRHPEKYATFVKKIKSCCSENFEAENELLTITSTHVIKKYVEKYSDESKIYQNTLLKLKESLLEPAEFLKSLFSDENELAILCHGDFNRNNLMFLYNNDAMPIGVKLIDLQTPRYGSPVIDISFFAYLNSKPEMRLVHWDRLYTEYFTYLTTHLHHELQVEQLPECFTLDRWKQEYSRYAIYGFFIASFFLRVMMSSEEFVSKIKWKWHSTGKKDPRDNLLFGTPETDDLLVEIIREFIQNHFIKSD